MSSDSTGTGHDPVQEYDGELFPPPLRGDPGEETEYCDYPIRTWVTVDGTVVPCSTDLLRVGQPVIMDGLSFSWGRDSIIDQPGANTCAFTMREELDPRWLGDNVIEDPTFDDPTLNAVRFPATWPIEDGEVWIGGRDTPEQILATNILTDPGFEYGKGGFNYTQATVDTEHVHGGAQAIKITPTADGNTYDARASFVAEAGKSYVFTAWQWVPSGTTRTHNLATGQGVATAITYNDDAVLFDQWQKVTLLTTPATRDGGFYVHLYGGDVTGQPVWYDDVTLAEGSTPIDDFSGDTPAADGISYRWTGTPGASPSQQYIPAKLTANADSMRIWLIGDRRASTSSTGVPTDGLLPVVTGQTYHLSALATASVDRQVRWQIATYDAAGTIIHTAIYVGSDTPLTANTPTLVENDWTVPDDGTAYIAVAFVPEGGYGGSVILTQPDIYTTDTVSLIDLVHVGSAVEIWCDALVPAVGSEVMADTGFSGTGNTLPNERWTIITAAGAGRPDTPPPINTFGGSDPAVWLIRRDLYEAWSATAVFGPDEFITDPEAEPNAWDLIPRLTPGGSWHITAHVWVPPLTTVTLTAYAYTGPHKDDLYATPCVVTADDAGNPMAVTGTIAEMQGDSGWYTIEGDVTLPASFTDSAGAWIAPGISIDELPSPLTWADTPGTWAQQTLRWVDLQRVGIDYLSMEQEAASTRTGMIWSGEITQAIAQAAGDCAYTAAITASDLSSILANVKIGDEPWPQQTVAARAAAIMALIPQSPPLVIDDGLQDTLVSYRDVDAQAPFGLLQDLAQTAGGVLWITAHATQGAYLWMEDPRTRAAVRRFVVAPDAPHTVSITDGETPNAGIAVISAMDILRDPVNWTQDTSQVITQASIGWLEEIPPAEGEQTTTEDHTEVVQDTADVIERYGIRDASLGTELTTANDARELGARILAMSRGTGWKADGLEYDTLLLVRDITTVDYPTRLNIILDLLDATTRIGYPITLVDMPTWTPAGAVRSMYIEGGTYTWDGHRWHLAMTATPSAGQGVSARWEDFAGTGATWNDFRPNQIRWLDAYGTSGPQVADPRDQDQLEEARTRG